MCRIGSHVNDGEGLQKHIASSKQGIRYDVSEITMPQNFSIRGTAQENTCVIAKKACV